MQIPSKIFVLLQIFQKYIKDYHKNNIENLLNFSLLCFKESIRSCREQIDIPMSWETLV